MSSDQTDRRKHPRIRTSNGVPVKISYESEADRLSRTGFRLTKDISLQGLRFESSYDVPAEQKVHLQIALGQSSRAIKQDAKVCWSRANPQNNTYEIGIEFVDSHPRDSRLWERYIVDQNPSTS